MAPLVERWSRKYGTRGIKFFKIMVMENELIALDFLKHYRSTFPHTVDFDKKVTEDFHATSWPNAVVIDKSGKVIAHEYIWKRGIRILEDALDRVAGENNYVVANSLAHGGSFCKGGICYSPIGEDSAPLKTRQEFPRLAASPDGYIYLAYTANETGDNNIFLEKYKRGRLKKRYQITATPSDDYEVSIAASGDGTIWLAWTSNADSMYDIYAASLKDGRLSEAMRVTKSANDAFHPRIAVDYEGKPWIAYYKWLMIDGSSRDRNIYIRNFADGRWSEELEVSPPEPALDDHSDPDITALERDVLIAWSYDYHPSLKGNTLDAAGPTVFAQDITQEMQKKDGLQLMGSKGKDERIKDISPSISSWGQTAACAWDAKKSIMVRRQRDGRWSGVEKVSLGASPCNAPAVAVTRKGVRVCYSQLVDGRWRIIGRVYDDGFWGTQEFLDNGRGDCRFPVLGSDKKGNFWVAFTEQTDKDVKVLLRKW